MSTITIRDLDPALKERLRVRAAEHGHSMEAEVRLILQDVLKGHARPPATGPMSASARGSIRSAASTWNCRHASQPVTRPGSTRCSCSTPTFCPPSWAAGRCRRWLRGLPRNPRSCCSPLPSVRRKSWLELRSCRAGSVVGVRSGGARIFSDDFDGRILRSTRRLPACTPSRSPPASKPVTRRATADP